MTMLCPIERATGDLFLLKGHAHLDVTKLFWLGMFAFESNRREIRGFLNAIYSIWI